MLDLQPIKDRLAAATPGPWTASPNVQPHGVAAVAEVNTVLVLSSGPLYGSPAQDADLIANAPTDLAALVAEVERLRKSLAETQFLVDSYSEALYEAEADAARLRAAIKRHRETTTLRLGGASPWATDIELWAVLDA